MAAHFTVYKDSAGLYRWRLRAGNNVIVASSGESFSSKEAAISRCGACRTAAAEATTYIDE